MTYDHISTAAAWTASELRNHPDWIYQLLPSEIAEIDQALAKQQNSAYQTIDQSSFPLKHLSKKIAQKFLPQLEDGIGTLLIKGIDINKYSLSELEKLFYGLGTHFGTAVSQSQQGETLHHVYDHQVDGARGANSNVELCFHNDVCDVASLFAIRKAKEGGMSQLVSSVSIHNQLLKNHPHLLPPLYQPYYFFQKITAGQPCHAKPIFSIINDKFICNTIRAYIDWAQEKPDIPKMTALQIEAIDKLEEIANSLCYQFYLQPGDMLFFNSYTTLHARKTFHDAANNDQKRLLLRLWLSTDNSRELPESYRPFYDETKAGAIRGGIQPPQKQVTY